MKLKKHLKTRAEPGLEMMGTIDKELKIRELIIGGGNIISRDEIQKFTFLYVIFL